MIRTLFVDDEVAVLEGLENRLRRLRRRWRMEFALGAERALERLRREHFDAIVTDMRMPGIDGAELLTRVRKDFPSMVRIVLSGQTAQDRLLRVLPLAHQILAKPCDVDAIEEAVERARLLQQSIHTREVSELIACVQHLPPLPRLYMRVTELLGQPDAGIGEVADLIAQDVAMTARLLQLVNSGLLGLRRKVATVHEAATYLGINAVRSLVLSIEVFNALENTPRADGYDLETLQGHSLLTARLARELLGDSPDAQDAFSAGILHDVGRLVMATYAPERLVEAGEAVQAHGGSMEAAELEVNGFTHAEVGGALLSLWGLHSSIVEAVVYHHEPSRSAARSFGALGAVHVADRVVHARAASAGAPLSPDMELFDMEFLERVAVAERVPEFLTLSIDPEEA